MMTKLAILGSTGSIGTQALEVAAFHGYEVDLISGNQSIQKLEEQIRRFHPRFCAVANKDAAKTLQIKVQDTQTKIFFGEEGILDAIQLSNADVYVNAILGAAGLKPTFACIEKGKRLALANKESLVIAGDLVHQALKEYGTALIPVDSEHSAIFQALSCGETKEVKKILLTASGGPFFDYTKEQLQKVTLKDTLKHPTWSMGKKITVDSATLMNKGFEIMEASHLFHIPPKQIEVLVHRESIVHSAVEFVDHTVIAELSQPDMRSCIQHAITYPKRMEGLTKELDLFSLGNLSFYKPDEELFPLLPFSKKAMEIGGGVPCCVNAANEIAVSSFLQEQLSFTGIFDVVINTVEKMTNAKNAKTLSELFAIDKETRALAKEHLR